MTGGARSYILPAARWRPFPRWRGVSAQNLRDRVRSVLSARPVVASAIPKVIQARLIVLGSEGLGLLSEVAGACMSAGSSWAAISAGARSLGGYLSWTVADVREAFICGCSSRSGGYLIAPRPIA